MTFSTSNNARVLAAVPSGVFPPMGFSAFTSVSPLYSNSISLCHCLPNISLAWTPPTSSAARNTKRGVNEGWGTLGRGVLTSHKFWSDRAALKQTAVAHQSRKVGPIHGRAEETVCRLIGGRDEYPEIHPHEPSHSRNVLGKSFILPEPGQLRILHSFFGRWPHRDRPTACPLDEFHVEDLRETVQILDKEGCNLCERDGTAFLRSHLYFGLEKDCLRKRV